MRGSHPPRPGESGKGVLWDTYLTGEGRTSYGVKKQDTAVNMLPVLFFIMGRIDPVEHISVSQQRNGNVLNVKPPAMRVRDDCYTKITFPL